jgi:hypothetical protein
MSSRIRIIDHAASHALPATAEAWLRELGGSSLIRVRGRDPSRTRVVTTLLHGDEPSGTRAIHAWLRAGVEPATDVLFYIGAVDAALAGRGWAARMLKGRRDANRCFLPPFDDPDGVRAHELLELLAAARPEALVDLHNNSGHSPAYAVGTCADAPRLSLATLFADHYVQTDIRLGTLIEAADAFTTGIVVEAGRASDEVADALALAGIERYLSRDTLPVLQDGEAPSVVVLHEPCRVTIRPGVSLAFGDAPVREAGVTIRSDLDRHNLSSVDAGTLFGWLGDSRAWPFDARGADGVEISHELFSCTNGVLRTRRPLVPIMMTTSREAAANDCLFYAVQRR